MEFKSINERKLILKEFFKKKFLTEKEEEEEKKDENLNFVNSPYRIAPLGAHIGTKKYIYFTKILLILKT